LKSNEEIDHLFVFNLYKYMEDRETVDSILRMYSYHEGYGGQSGADFIGRFHGDDFARVILSLDYSDQGKGGIPVVQAHTAIWKFVSTKVCAENKNHVKSVYQQLLADSSQIVYGSQSAKTMAFVSKLHKALNSKSAAVAEMFALPEWENASCVLPSTMRRVLALKPADKSVIVPK
jgi:hypothetical protein